MFVVSCYTFPYSMKLEIFEGVMLLGIFGHEGYGCVWLLVFELFTYYSLVTHHNVYHNIMFSLQCVFFEINFEHCVLLK